MVETLGYVGAAALAICGIPQAIKSWREGHSAGVSHGMILLWGVGDLSLLAYVALKYPNDLALIANYVVNAAVIGVIAKYKYLPRELVVLRR